MTEKGFLYYKNKFFPILAAFFSAIAVSVSGEYLAKETILETLRAELDGIGLSSLIVLLAFCFLYSRFWGIFCRVQHWTVHVLAVLFAGFMMIGLSFSQNGNLDFVLGSRKQMAVAAAVYAGYLIFFEIIMRGMYLLLDKRSQFKRGNKSRDVKQGAVRSFIEHHYFVFSLSVIVICWLPWLVVFLPGSIPFDGYKALLMGYGEFQLTDQHSWVLTLMIAFLMRLGQSVSDNFGIFLITIVLVAFEAFCYAFSCRIISKWKLPFDLKAGIPLFFGILPIFGAYAQAIVKDSPFMAAVVLYMTLYADMCLVCRKKTTTSNLRKRLYCKFVGLLVTGYVVCILRNNGPYLILPASFLLIVLVNKKMRKYAVLLFAGTLSLFWIHGHVLAPAAGVESITGRAKLYMSFQVVGRYLSEYPEDLSESDKDVLSTVFEGYEEIAEVYEPNVCDPVKSLYNNNSSSEDLHAYVNVLINMFRRHPRVCVEAILNQSYGYYYPFERYEYRGTYKFQIKGSLANKIDMFDIYYVMPEGLRNAMKQYAELWRQIPGLAFIMSPAMPTWVLLFLAGYLAYRKKWRGILLLAAPSLNMVICMLSPVNGYLRYAMPSTACMPIVFFWCLLITGDDNDFPAEIECVSEAGSQPVPSGVVDVERKA